MSENTMVLFKADDARFRVLTMHLDLFANLLFGQRLVNAAQTEARFVEIEGLPEDARAQAICFDPMARLVRMRVWSSEFAEVEEAHVFPELVLTFQEHRYRIIAPDPADAGIFAGAIQLGARP